MTTNTETEPKQFTAFISMPFDAFFDDLYHQGIKAVNDHLKAYRLKIIRLDESAYRKQRIQENVLAHIDTSDLLIADISRYPKSPSPNVSVMHEIGYAAGRRLPVVLIGSPETLKALPSNLQGDIVTVYDHETDHDYSRFAVKLAHQLEATISEKVLPRVRGEYQLEGFSGRNGVHLDYLISLARQRVFILTTNLSYTASYLCEAIKEAVERNKGNPDFRVEILTMDPESNVANERAVQLGRTARVYRDELRESLEHLQRAFTGLKNVEIMTYTSLPTQMTFIVDNHVVVAVVSMTELSREGTHFLLSDSPRGAEPFIGHFRAVKTHRRTHWH
ncbi:MAG: hypothetical protein HOP02_15660 [Methylococcaceae bacterium]|nr:hypothetical protein [Methylococcaceae bacterium]